MTKRKIKPKTRAKKITPLVVRNRNIEMPKVYSTPKAMHPLLSINCSVVNCLRRLKPVMNLAIRLFIASLFIKIGLVRISDWEATVFLFEHEYKLPLLEPSAAACIVAMLNLVVAPMLAVGFGTRYAAILLFIMVSAMHFFYQAEMINYYYMLLLGMLAVYGGSKLSIDYLLRRRYCGRNMCRGCNCMPCKCI